MIDFEQVRQFVYNLLIGLGMVALFAALSYVLRARAGRG